MNNQVDLEDVAPIAVYPVVLGIMLGVFTFTLNVFGGFTFGKALIDNSTLTVTVAGLLSLVSGGAVVVTNEIDGSNYEQWEYGAILTVFLFPVLFMVIPAVSSFVLANGFVAFSIWLIATVTTVYVSYAE